MSGFDLWFCKYHPLIALGTIRGDGGSGVCVFTRITAGLPRSLDEGRSRGWMAGIRRSNRREESLHQYRYYRTLPSGIHLIHEYPLDGTILVYGIEGSTG